jgi:hypothetical protein
MLKGGIDPGDTHEDCATATLLEHLEGDAPGS